MPAAGQLSNGVGTVLHVWPFPFLCGLAQGTEAVYGTRESLPLAQVEFTVDARIQLQGKVKIQ